MTWQLAEKIPRLNNLEAASVSSFEFLPWTASLGLASCLPINVPENIYFKVCRKTAKFSGIHLCETPSLFLPFVHLLCPGLISNVSERCSACFSKKEPDFRIFKGCLILHKIFKAKLERWLCRRRGWQNRLGGLSLIPRTQEKAQGENWLHKAVIWPS